MHAGDTFLIPGDDDHLWAIISDPAKDLENVVVVLFLSWAEKYDQACALHAGDHPFIKHDTCVGYRGAKVLSNRRREELRRAGKLRLKAPLSAQLLELIRNKAEVSDIPSGAYSALRNQGLVP